MPVITQHPVLRRVNGHLVSATEYRVSLGDIVFPFTDYVQALWCHRALHEIFPCA